MHGNAIDMAGKQIGKWLVVGPFERKPNGLRWLCRCECGTEKYVEAGKLRNGSSSACKPCASTRHGLSKTPEYFVWSTMRARCKPGFRQHADYYDRGIRVCAEWDRPGGFEAFIAHMGRRPSDDLTVERVDNDRGYEPGNVCWATRLEQRHNRRDTVRS